MMKRIFPFFVFLSLIGVGACSDNDDFSSDKALRITFSVDTLKIDTVFTNVGSSTYTFWIFNRSDAGIRIESVRLEHGNQTGFRVNVDGTYLDNSTGSIVTDLELQKGDSLRVFVELTAPEQHRLEPQRVADNLLFKLKNGVEQRVPLVAWAWDALKVTDMVVSRDTIIESRQPIVVYGTGIRVDSAATLTIKNTTLYFHDGAGMLVRGRLVTDSVVMRGDRLDRMFDYLPYDRVSGQWRGIQFAQTSDCNNLKRTEIRNAECAVLLSDSARLDSLVPRLTMSHCVIHNSKVSAIVSYNSHLALDYCQVTNAGGDCLSVYGGICAVDHCTLAQFYPFIGDRGVALRFADNDSDNLWTQMRLTCRNSIFTGYEDDVVMAAHTDRDSTDFSYYFENCLLRTPAVEDDTISFRNVRWETAKDSVQGKQHFRLIDEENLIYDFHLDSLTTVPQMGCYPLSD